MPIPEVLDRFETYIHEEIPFRLIDLTTMQLVHVDVVEHTYLPLIESITEADIERHTSYANQRREDVITTIVKGTIKYAILSHTWSLSGHEEFKYHDMVSDTPRTGPSWHKLDTFCTIARESFKCRFAWADTICLDYHIRADRQSVSQNLFHWFRNAYVCIAYLEGSSTVDDLDRDRWFLRGWTLTELLAPVRMKFYGVGWKALNNDVFENDKADRSFLMALSQASRVPADDLLSFRPGPDRIRHKLSWAANRHTAVSEDRAYSLMALFDIHLSVAYGEGERAFIRLMLEAIPRSGECDVFAWAGEHARQHPALPSSPTGYASLSHNDNDNDNQLVPTAHHYRLCGDRALSIDARHLRMRVVLVLISTDLFQPAVATCRPIPLTHEAHISQVTLIGCQDWRTRPMTDAQMALGVIDYGWTDSPDEGVLHKGNTYFCFLLYRHSNVAEWQKVDTEKVVYLTSGEEVIQKLETLCLRLDCSYN